MQFTRQCNLNIHIIHGQSSHTKSNTYIKSIVSEYSESLNKDLTNPEIILKPRLHNKYLLYAE